MVKILVVCTANQCRSPLTAAVLGRRLAEHGVAAEVDSAGLFGGALPVPADVATAASAYGLDLSDHRSRQVVAEDVRGADLVVGMERAHVRELVLLSPERWPATYTLRELVRRGAAVGACRPDQTLDGWLRDVNTGRRPADLLGASSDDDVADPMGGPPAAYDAMAAEVATLTAELVRLGWGARPDRRSIPDRPR